MLWRQDNTSGKAGYYFYNGHGDVVAIKDAVGININTYDYDIWGNVLSKAEGMNNPYRYTGEQQDDESGLIYLRARYYDPTIGRFISQDTVEGDLNNPLTLNLYTYVQNNPLRYTDPSGQKECSEDCANSVYIVAGVATSQDFFDNLKAELIAKYEEQWIDIYIQTIFPYGDISENMLKQGAEVIGDTAIKAGGASRSTGGQKVRDYVKSNYGGGELVFIGHSGGGIAVYHGAEMLETLDGYKVKQVVQIGSPQVQISTSFQNRVSYIYTSKDFITSIGQGNWDGMIKYFDKNLCYFYFITATV